MPDFKMTLTYDGTAYAGWQVQADAITIQQVVEDAIEHVTGERVRVTASGRTDAGVHALGQVASFALDSARLSASVLCRAINANTPADIHVMNVEEAADGFHAIRDATGKRYRYVLQEGPAWDLFTRAYAWRVPQPLDLTAMTTAAELLVGTHDFSSFEAAGSERRTSVRTVVDLTVERQWHETAPRVVIEIEADGFLYNMVRNIVGSLVVVGQGSADAKWLGEVFHARDRRQAAATAPPQGLFLLRVKYDKL